jgi:2'-hydroxyisoflavone reductase
MPIWQSGDSEDAGILFCASARAEKKGLKFRSLETTIRDTLAWQKGRPEDKQKLRAGLTMEKEADLLAKLRAG